VVIPSEGHGIVERIEESDTLSFASLHKELRRKAVSAVHRKGDRGATNRCTTTAFPVPLGSDICVVAVATREILLVCLTGI
jgi:hypothetical protein